MQWPITKEDTPVLHLEEFRTPDGKGYFQYHQYKLREQIEKLVKKKRHLQKMNSILQQEGLLFTITMQHKQ